MFIQSKLQLRDRNIFGFLTKCLLITVLKGLVGTIFRFLGKYLLNIGPLIGVLTVYSFKEKLAPSFFNHHWKSPNVSSPQTHSPGNFDAFSEVSSFVSESTAMTEPFELDGDQGVQVLRSKMKRRRRREAKRAHLSNHTSLSRSYSGGSSFNDSLSAITDSNSKDMENDRFNDLTDEKPILDNWQLDRPESDQVFTSMGPPPTPPSPVMSFIFVFFPFVELDSRWFDYII